MKDYINIRPKVSILSVLKHLNYKPWYAAAEFVDNAIDSYHKEAKHLKKLEDNYLLKVKIDFNKSDKKITITDNAGGIHHKEFPRAFRTAEIPPDRSGLSEFGMGMKSASCWFTNNWQVRTKSLDDSYEYLVKFDVSKIVKNQIEELKITKKKVRKEAHYTVIELLNVENFPVGHSQAKIKKHLTTIYRQFIRNNEMKLLFNGDELEYNDPQILLAPFYKEEKGLAKSWRKEINVKIDKKHSVKGFVAIRETGSTLDAGFAIFRRNRVIQGSGDEGYRPEMIFGNPNSYAYQRVFGELFLEGFGVSHTKDGIQWKGLEETFLQKLKAELKKKPDLLAQAEGYRKRPKLSEIKEQSQGPLNRTSTIIEKEGPTVLNDLKSQEVNKNPPPEKLPDVEENLFKQITLNLDDETWEVHLELSFDETVTEWIDIGENYIRGKKTTPDCRQVGIRLSMQNPFMIQFIGVDRDKIEPILRIAAAIGIAEVIARSSGVKYASEVRRNINELIGSTLSKVE